MISKKQKQAQLERAQKQAEKYGGKCLTETYNKSQQKMTWKCSNPSHSTWDASYTLVVHHDVWCAKCTAEAKLARAHKVAEERGGKCLTTVYSGSKARMEFKCNNPNHAPWTARYTAVVNDGHWCAKCYEDGRKKGA